MSEAEVAAFEKEPYFRDGIQLRRWDDEGKIAGMEVPDLGHLESYIDSCRND